VKRCEAAKLKKWEKFGRKERENEKGAKSIKMVRSI
jgi:hypothetical protein